MKIQWPLQMKSAAISVILLKKIADREEAIKAAMAITNQELDAVIVLVRELIATRSSKERKKTILETQLSQNVIYKKIKGIFPLIFFSLLS